MSEIVIVDYKLGNLFSVQNALLKLGADAIISNNLDEIENAKALILPGVGAFKEAMIHLNELNLIDPIKRHVEQGKPFMGVCLGLQLLFSESHEFGTVKGLGVLEGEVNKIPLDENKLNVPQIGWNKISLNESMRALNHPLKDINEDDYLYFVHSFFIKPKDKQVELSYTTYGKLIYCSAVIKQNIFATQFHPEKSGEVGLKIYENWLRQNELKIKN